MLLNLKLLSRAKLCPVSALPDVVKDWTKMRNLPKIFLRSFENVGPGDFTGCNHGNDTDIQTDRQTDERTNVVVR